MIMMMMKSYNDDENVNDYDLNVFVYMDEK